MSEILWQPDGERIAQANLTAFMREVNAQFGVGAHDYDALWAWSVAEREQFWEAVWTFCGVRASQPWEQVLVDGDRMPGARWFVGARLNFAKNLLRERSDRTAVVFWNENGPQRRLTFAELYVEVARVAAALRGWGVGPGMCVAAYLPNLPETLIAMLAAASVGATFSSCSPDFGVTGVLDRLGQIAPDVLFTADGYQYAGKAHDCLPRVREILAGLPTVKHTVVVPYLNHAPAFDGVRGAVRWDELPTARAESLSFAQLPFDHPLYILYSSGTTGAPKCIVHGAGGTLLQHLKEHVLHTDLKPSDRLFYFTTCGWMMWNWLASGLATGAALVLYDGSPLVREGQILFDLAAEEQVTVFGTGAKYLAACEKARLSPRTTHRLDALRTILSTGSPLAGEQFDYVYQHIKRDVCLSSISGGTDIVSCFALGDPIGPVRRGEIQKRGLGMKVEVYSEEGRPLVGAKGELVCTAAFPAMPLGFGHDPDGAKYRAAYFERFANIWTHGDWCELTPHGGLIIYGRSDATLNPGGVRIGTAEIYRLVEYLPEIVESLVVGQTWQGDVRVVLFVRLADGVMLDEMLIDRIRRHIRAEATPRHVPAKIIAVAEIPRTKSGKIVELAVRNVIHGVPVTNCEALANPESLEQFRDLPELR